MDSPNQIFSPEELTSNEKRKTDLVEAIYGNEVVLFVGAGISQPMYPSWKKLIIMLEELAVNCDNSFEINPVERENRPWDYVDKIKKHIETKFGNINRYYNKLKMIFDDKECKNIHRKLISLPFIGIITSNYDFLLEKAVIEKDQSVQCFLTLEDDTRDEVSDFLSSLNASRGKKNKIVHIHGIYKRPSTIILSSSDYEHFYGFDSKGKIIGEPKLPYKFLWSVLSTRRIIFIGFGMSDLYLKYMLSYVCDDLWRWSRDSHFLITDINSREKISKIEFSQELNDRFGITTIFYENEDGSHSGLEVFLDEIANSFKIESKAQPTIKEKTEVKSKILSAESRENFKQKVNEINKQMINKSKNNAA